jgi:putative ABC transport system ATP-binding protein
VIADIRVRDLTVEYVSGEYAVRPIDGFDLDAGSGELVVLLGPSGCGKTTLLSCLAGILTPTAGSITVGSTEVTELRGDELTAYRQRTVGIVFQAFNLIPSLTALENTAVPLTIAGVPGKKARPRAAELLETVGLSDRAGHLPSELSGGQQQRVAIARALVNDPFVILADEPTGNLDERATRGIFQLLKDINANGTAVVMATHDLDLVRQTHYRSVELQDGVVVFDSAIDEHIVEESAI